MALGHFSVSRRREPYLRPAQDRALRLAEVGVGVGPVFPVIDEACADGVVCQVIDEVLWVLGWIQDVVVEFRLPAENKIPGSCEPNHAVEAERLRVTYEIAHGVFSGEAFGQYMQMIGH